MQLQQPELFLWTWLTEAVTSYLNSYFKAWSDKFHFVLAAWHSIIGQVGDLTVNAVVTGTRGLLMLVSSNYLPDTCTEAITWRWLPQFLRFVYIRPRSWYFQFPRKLILKSRTHRKLRVLIFCRWVVRLIGACSWHVQVRKTFQFFAHENSTFSHSMFLDAVVSWAWNRFAQFIIEHSASLWAELVIRRLCLGLGVPWAILSWFCLHVFCLVNHCRINSETSANAPIRCSFHGPLMEFICTWTRNQLVFFRFVNLLELRWHRFLRAILACKKLFLISARPWSQLVLGAAHLRTQLVTEWKLWSLYLTVAALVIAARTWFVICITTTSNQRRPLASTDWESWLIQVLQVWFILQFIVTWAWHTLFHILIHCVCLRMHVNFRSIGDMRG